MAFIRTSRDDSALIVIFARPPANAFNLALIEELTGAVFSGGVDDPMLDHWV